MHAIFVLVLSILLVGPIVGATHLSPGADIEYDLAREVEARYRGIFLGMEAPRTAGPPLDVMTPYDLTLRNIASPPPGATTIELRTPDGVIVAVANLHLDGANPGSYAATFILTGTTLQTSGLYDVHVAGGARIGRLFAHPARDIDLEVLPTSFPAAAPAWPILVRATGAPEGDGLAGVRLSGPGVADDAETGLLGLYAGILAVPPAGEHDLWAELSTSAFASGPDLPERVGASTLRVL